MTQWFCAATSAVHAQHCQICFDGGQRTLFHGFCCLSLHTVRVCLSVAAGLQISRSIVCCSHKQQQQQPAWGTASPTTRVLPAHLLVLLILARQEQMARQPVPATHQHTRCVCGPGCCSTTSQPAPPLPWRGTDRCCPAVPLRGPPQAPPSKADPKKTMTADCVLGKQTPDVKTL